MNWKNFLGDALYEKLNAAAKNRKMTIATLVRLSVESYLSNS